MLSVAIVDDNKSEAELLRGFVEKYGKENSEETEIFVFSSGVDFLEGYSSKYDIVFMDIKMRDMDGMTVSHKLRQVDKNVYLIFVTSMAKYAIDGYKVNAMDYFLKPVYYADIEMRLRRISEEKKKADFYIMVLGQNGAQRFLSNEIYYIESMEHNIIFHTYSDTYTQIRPNILLCSSGEVKTIKNANMKTLEAELEKFGFARCNACYIVNLKYCRKIEGFSLTIGKDVLQMSHSRKKEFMNTLMSGFRL